MTSLVCGLRAGMLFGVAMLLPMAIAFAAEDDVESAKPALAAPATTEPAADKPATPVTPAVGSQAIDFSLTSGEGKATSLKDYQGKWVVLYFYPKDFTGGCTLEAHNFERDLAKYKDLNAVILGVSVDTPESHKEFCTKEHLTFKLLSDPSGKVSTQYGSVMEYEGAKLSARNTFLIAPDGKIAKVYTKVNPTAHSDEVLAALGELQKKS
ncbi:MAG TPA: peroxiredoxin [Candidatus Udaeobacter sp.]|nr:peroxiredoxin [Candidatus Udaeobacter sp.]